MQYEVASCCNLKMFHFNGNESMFFFVLFFAPYIVISYNINQQNAPLLN